MSGKRTGSKDRRAEFEQAALPLMDPLYSMAMRMTGNPEDASDLVQETFLKSYRSFESFEWGTNIRAWMFKILVNTYYNIYRHRRLGKELEEASGGFWMNRELVSQETLRAFRDPHSAVSSSVVNVEIERAVKGLPEDYRNVFLLADVQGFSYKEVASTVGCPIGTVMSRLHRARRLMQRALLGDGAFERQERGEAPDGEQDQDQDEGSVAEMSQWRDRKAGGGRS